MFIYSISTLGDGIFALYISTLCRDRCRDNEGVVSALKEGTVYFEERMACVVERGEGGGEEKEAPLNNCKAVSFMHSETGWQAEMRGCALVQRLSHFPIRVPGSSLGSSTSHPASC